MRVMLFHNILSDKDRLHAAITETDSRINNNPLFYVRLHHGISHTQIYLDDK